MVQEKKSVGPDPDPTEYLFVSLEMKRQDQTKPYDGKTLCWVPDAKEGFVQGSITGEKGDLTVVKVGGEEKTFKKDQVGQVNPPKYEKCEDMSNLTYLNDASVLHNLRQRYYNKLIYTYSGLFCVAINPYKRYPIYTPRCMAIYKGRRRNEVPPHLFAISDGAYCAMLQNNENQSMLITGESGAGKTENTKKVIAYLADVAANVKKDTSKKVSLEDQIVQTNPVLEAFGNAKTTRNDNSSRFGKFIRIHFGTSGKLAGADIEVYLLEKARVIACMPLERSYHIFYYMLSRAVPYMSDLCLFESFGVQDFKFINQGKFTINGVDDAEEMTATDEAFDILGFSKDEKENVYRITAAVMHMGELKFKQKGREEQAEPDGMGEGERVAKLMGVGHDDLYKNFCKPRIKVGTEFVTKGQNLAQVMNNVGAMAKAIFDRLFKFLVKKCNDTLDTKQSRAQFIGVLDIAGFEIFDFNGFDQLCINFTNEKLQQFFNHHMFVLEQEEYQKEGIDWVFVDFGMDLQACIELMEKKLGLFAILEEESMFPKATDQTFDAKLKAQHLGKSPSFIKPKPPKPGQVEAHFAIAHYAGVVPYNLTGWLEKNKDPLNDTVCDQFKKGTNNLVVDIFADHPGQSGGKDDGPRKKGAGFSTVSSSYREQLNNLMTTLKATQPHFIRCIIPNELKQPGLVDAALVMHQLTCNGVLEGIRICRKGFPNRTMYHDFCHRYLILAPNQMKAEKEEKAKAQACFDAIALDKDKFRLGKTKVFFRAGVMGELEEIRDDRLSKIITWIQSVCRNYISRKASHALLEQRKALVVIQRNLRQFMKLRCWPWWHIWLKLKPNIKIVDKEEEIRKLDEKVKKAEEAFEQATAARKEVEAAGVALLEAKNAALKQLEEQEALLGNTEAVISKIKAQKADLDSQLNDSSNRLSQAEDSRNQLQNQKNKLDKELSGLQKELQQLEGNVQKGDQDKQTKELQIRNLNDELAQQEELIQKLNKEKKQSQEQIQKLCEDAQVVEDKANHLNRVKAKLEQSLDSLEDSLEREKKLRGDVEKTKRKVEGDLKLTQEAVADLERSRKELEQTIQRKDKEVSSITAKLEDEQGLVAKLQRQLKELQARIEELAEELEAERQSRSKSEKQRADLTRELEELVERLEAAGGATSAQIELNKKREAETAKLKRDAEELSIQHESALGNLRKKHNDSVAEMAQQIDNLNKLKTKAEKDQTSVASELNEARASLDHLSSEKVRQEKLNKQLSQQIDEMSSRFDQVSKTLDNLDSAKKRLTFENADLGRQLEETESQISQLSKLKVSLSTQLEDTKRLADEEARERATLFGKFRNVEHDLDGVREQLDEEADTKSDLQRQLSKANSDAQLWRNKYESEGIARTEELEEAKRKLQSRLAEAAETVESMNQKIVGLERAKQHFASELESTHSEVDRARTITAQIEKKQKYLDSIINQWKLKVDDLSAELDASQKDCRNYASDLFRLKATYEENQDQLQTVRRENKNLADEIKDLMDQIGEGGRNIHEIEKQRKRLEIEKDELQAALEEAESTLEQEENKVLRGQLELAQVRQEIDRRVAEKDEEFENTRKNHQRALDSMQASLEAEVKGKNEALRVKKAAEATINELEIALDHSNKANTEAQKSIKRYQQQLTEIRTHLEEEQRAREQTVEQVGIAERRANALANEVEESRTLLEQADRVRRQTEQELGDAREQINDLSNQATSLNGVKRNLEAEHRTLQSDLEEILNEAKNSEEKAKRAMVDAARLADDLRNEQEQTQATEKARKTFESQIKELQLRLDEANSNSLKGGKSAIAKLEARIRSLDGELDSEQKRHTDTQKNLRKGDRRVKELAFQVAEDQKNYERMQDLADKLNQKIKTYKKQIEEAEEIAALNLAKFQKATQELEEAEERAELNSQAAARARAALKGAPVRAGSRS